MRVMPSIAWDIFSQDVERVVVKLGLGSFNKCSRSDCDACNAGSPCDAKRDSRAD